MNAHAVSTPRATDLVIDRWRARLAGRSFPCAIGKGGRRLEKREGDGATPVGVFGFEYLLFRPDRQNTPRASLPTRPIRPFDGWSDDPKDPAYNQPVRRPHPFNAERLRRPDPLYDLVLVFDANRRPIQPGRGSALFIHLWRGPRRPTEGCVAFHRRDLLWILRHLTRRSRLIIHP